MSFIHLPLSSVAVCILKIDPIVQSPMESLTSHLSLVIFRFVTEARNVAVSVVNAVHCWDQF